MKAKRVEMEVHKSLPVVIKLRVSRLRIWVTIVYIIAGIRVLKTQIHSESQKQKLINF